MRIRNKRGQAGELIQDIVGLIFVAILLIMFFVFSNILWGFSDRELKTIAAEEAIQDQEYLSLYSVLQKPVTLTENRPNPQEITIADLIRLSKIDPEYQERLDLELEKSLGDIYDYELLEPEEETNNTFYIPSRDVIKTKLKINEVK